MTHPTHFRVSQKVVFEAFDDEVILVNLDNGHYYTLAGSAGDIWNALSAGTPVADIAALLGDRYTGTVDEIAPPMERFVAELQAERLIVPGDGAVDAGTGPTFPVSPVLNDDRPPFEAPVLAKYTDMEALLILDPVHDVDESGWPEVAMPVAAVPAPLSSEA